jgi:hypothetical protein
MGCGCKKNQQTEQPEQPVTETQQPQAESDKK